MQLHDGISIGCDPVCMTWLWDLVWLALRLGVYVIVCVVHIWST